MASVNRINHLFAAGTRLKPESSYAMQSTENEIWRARMENTSRLETSEGKHFSGSAAAVLQ